MKTEPKDQAAGPESWRKKKALGVYRLGMWLSLDDITSSFLKSSSKSFINFCIKKDKERICSHTDLRLHK